MTITASNAIHVDEVCTALRSTRTQLLETFGARVLQQRMVYAIAGAAREWLDRKFSPVYDESTDYPKEMVWHSLEPLLLSMSEPQLWDYIETEEVLESVGRPVILHILAGNTPLLGVVAVVRALLVGSTSLVKLPAGYCAPWLAAFLQILYRHDPLVKDMICLTGWGRSEVALTRKAIHAVDLVVAYGDNLSVEEIKRLAGPDTPVIGYGHRMSIAIVARASHFESVAEGLALDTLLYDQSGCLSPQCVFVEGNAEQSDSFAEILARALDRNSLPFRSPTAERLAAVNSHRAMGMMTEGSKVIPGPDSRWTVISYSHLDFHISSGAGVIAVVPGEIHGIIAILSENAYLLQGAALSGYLDGKPAEWLVQLERLRLPYICSPGSLQKPPVHWRENAIPGLYSLVHPQSLFVRSSEQ